MCGIMKMKIYYVYVQYILLFLLIIIVDEVSDLEVYIFLRLPCG